MDRLIPQADQKRLQALLRQIRTETGLTQQELAHRLDRPQSFVSKYETGERRLDVLEIRLVCHVLGLTLSDFVSRLEKHLSSST